jgi:hypothetical protein
LKLCNVFILRHIMILAEKYLACDVQFPHRAVALAGNRPH